MLLTTSKCKRTKCIPTRFVDKLFVLSYSNITVLGASKLPSDWAPVFEDYRID